MTAYDRLVDALRADGRKVTEPKPGVARAQCPAHDDKDPSLSLRRVGGSVLVKCFSGCDSVDVLDALGLDKSAFFDEPSGAKYHYTDLAGTVLRTVHRTPEKRFTQSGQTQGSTTLYRLPRVTAAVAAEKTVYVVEGEKDVHALESIGLVATTAPMGSSSWSKVDPSPLFGGKVRVVVDRDKPGKTWAVAVRESLDGQVQSLEFVEAAEGKDAADHIAADLGPEDFRRIDLDEELPSRRARITWASQIEPEPVVWAWEEAGHGRIPSGSLSVAAGREGTGKSSFGIWLAAQVTRGALPGAFQGRPRRVFYVAVEDSWKFTLVPRLIAAGADLSKVGRFDVVTDVGDEVTLSLPSDNYLLERAVRDDDVALVVIDPLMSVIGEKIDTHRTREVRFALDPLAKLADRTGALLLGIAHFNKASGTDAASLLSGSHAFRDVPRTIFGFARDESDDNGGRVMSQVKNSLGRDDLPSLAYRIETAEVTTRKGPAITGKFVFLGESDEASPTSCGRTVMTPKRPRNGETRRPGSGATSRTLAARLRSGT